MREELCEKLEYKYGRELFGKIYVLKSQKDARLFIIGFL